jgi:hypothetical protein
MVRSSPAGARVAVNGSDRGVTPLALSGLAPGDYEIELTRPGYRAVSRRVAVSGDRSIARLSVTLPASARSASPKSAVSRASGAASGAGPAAIEVVSRPSGARVYIDGHYVGNTPYRAASVPPGQRAVRLELDGYGPWATNVTLGPGPVTRVAASLELQSRNP